jgi:hypothetical protein
VASHFIVFNYNGDHQITVTVFDETMCCRHYVAPARGKAAISPPPLRTTSSHMLHFIQF